MAKAKEEKVLQDVDTTQTAEQADNPSQSPAETALPEESLKSGAKFKLSKSEPTMAELVAAEKKRMEEYVIFEAFKGEGKYEDDVFLSVNGETCRFQRGIPVRIKRKFALEYERSYKGDQRTAARIALLAESAAKAKL